MNASLNTLSRSSVAARLAWLPVLVGIAVASVWVIHEVVDSIWIRNEKARLASIGKPLDASSRQAIFEQQTSREGTEAWRDAFMLQRDFEQLVMSAENVDKKWIFDTRAIATGLKDSEESARLRGFIQAMHPVLDQVRACSRLKMPVWEEPEFESGLLNNWPLHSLSRIFHAFHCDTLLALHDGDKTRALENLETMEKCIQAFDWRLSWNQCFAADALGGLLAILMGDSMQYDAWSEEQLEQLTKMFGRATPLNAKLLGAFHSERATAWTLLQRSIPSEWENSPRVFRFPSSDRAFLEAYLRHERDLRGIEEERVLYPFTYGLAKSLFEPQHRTNLAKTAIAVKRFQKKYGTWPQRQAELVEFGLELSAWQAIDLGYAVEDDIAYVWLSPGPREPANQKLPMKESEEFKQGHIFEIR